MSPRRTERALGTRWCSPEIILSVVVLPAPVRAEQGDDLTLIDRDREIVQAGTVPITDLHACHFEEAPSEPPRPGVVLAVGGPEVGVDDDRVLLDLGRASLAAITCPKLSTMIRSATDITSFMSCSIKSTVTPNCPAHPADQLGEIGLLSPGWFLRRARRGQHSGVRTEGPRDLETPAVPVGKRARELRSPFVSGRRTSKSSSVLMVAPPCSSAPGPRHRSMAPRGPVCCLDSTPIFTVLEGRQRSEHPGGLERSRHPEPVHPVGLVPMTLTACPFFPVKIESTPSWGV